MKVQRSTGSQRPDRGSESGEAHLWHIGAALAVGFSAAVLGLAALTWLAWTLLHHPKVPRPGSLSLHDSVSVLQLVFASVAGAGALVALIVAYRRQKIAEADSIHDRTRVFNERFTAIATQLGDDKPAVRLAGVHAMAGLADDWKTNRQTCIDVLCAYLRLPYEPDPGDQAPMPERLAFLTNREVRRTIIRVIAEHLKDDAPLSWQGLSFDFTNVVFDGGDFTNARFSGGTVNFGGAVFSGGTVNFSRARFSGGTVNFSGARFSGGTVRLDRAVFSGDTVRFNWASFSDGTVSFNNSSFSGGTVNFGQAAFEGSTVDFSGATFHSGKVDLSESMFSGGKVDFSWARFSGGAVDFFRATFSGGTVSFNHASFSGAGIGFSETEFSGSTVNFNGADFSGSTILFNRAQFPGGSTVDFSGAKFRSGTLDLSKVDDWSHPPKFDSRIASVVKLPRS